MPWYALLIIIVGGYYSYLCVREYGDNKKLEGMLMANKLFNANAPLEELLRCKARLLEQIRFVKKESQRHRLELWLGAVQDRIVVLSKPSAKKIA